MLTNQYFIDKGACYDPAIYLGEDWKGTIEDILDHKEVPIADKIWAGIAVMSDKQRRIFAVRCVRETPVKKGGFVVDLITDQRSIDAIGVAEKYANGSATSEELAAARDAASAAASAAAWDAASAAAWDAARAAASAAASAAAWDAASAAAWDAARDAARDAQLNVLREILITTPCDTITQ